MSVFVLVQILVSVLVPEREGGGLGHMGDQCLVPVALPASHVATVGEAAAFTAATLGASPTRIAQCV